MATRRSQRGCLVINCLGPTLRENSLLMTVPDNPLHIDSDGTTRCWWCGDDAQYTAYHDTEWGRPVDNDVRLFEKLCLEGFQAGLSWITILRKRENFRHAFGGFELNAVASMTEQDINRLWAASGILRTGGTIEAPINTKNRAQPFNYGAVWFSLFLGTVDPRARSSSESDPSPAT